MLLKHGGNIKKLAELAGCKAEEIIDFSANINPLGPPESLRCVLSRALDQLPHYPDPESGELTAALARVFGVAPEQIIVGNGSTEILYALPRALDCQRVILPVPSYLDYETSCRLAGLEVVSFPLREEDDFAIDWQELAARLEGGELVFLGQPNNPTGHLFEPDRLRDIARQHPETIFAIDESFAEFVEGYVSPVHGEGLPNLIMVRSLTKFYAIAGLRLGFAIAPSEFVARIREYILPWSVNALAQVAGVACLADLEYGRRTREYVACQRRELAESLSALPGLKVFPGAANYLLLKLLDPAMDTRQLAERLLARGIAIRVCDNYQGLDEKFFRVAVRTGDENILLCEALHDILGSRKTRLKPRKTPALMLQGTCSNAGKSVLTAALGRIFLEDGLRVAPFKAQNMSLNSYVTRDGLEMGRAQVVQAQACRLDPEVRMNPVLLKPSSDVGSQVIVNGRPVANMSVDQYVAYKPTAWQQATSAYDSLAAEFDVMVLEGAGSPAEINLKHHDIVNMAMARHAAAKVLLVGDIDRGGVFASFAGTLALLNEWERALVAGFVVNRFRGQESLLTPAYDFMLQATGRPVLGTVPYLKNLGLPEEDSVSFKAGLYDGVRPAGEHVEIALIDLPHISNFTDIEPFLAEPDVFFKIVRRPEDLDGSGVPPAAVILPGSKNVINDLAFLEQSGLGKRIRDLAATGKTEIVGICGGFQMLGQSVADPHGLESAGESVPGLGLLDLRTALEKNKTLLRQEFVHLGSGLPVHGYEIHHGASHGREAQLFRKAEGREHDAGAVSKSGLVWGSYLHGIFDADEFRRWFIDRLRERRDLAPLRKIQARYDLEPALDRLADVVRGALDMDAIYRLLKI